MRLKKDNKCDENHSNVGAQANATLMAEERRHARARDLLQPVVGEGLTMQRDSEMESVVNTSNQGSMQRNSEMGSVVNTSNQGSIQRQSEMESVVNIQRQSEGRGEESASNQHNNAITDLTKETTEIIEVEEEDDEDLMVVEGQMIDGVKWYVWDGVMYVYDTRSDLYNAYTTLLIRTQSQIESVYNRGILLLSTDIVAFDKPLSLQGRRNVVQRIKSNMEVVLKLKPHTLLQHILREPSWMRIVKLLIDHGSVLHQMVMNESGRRSHLSSSTLAPEIVPESMTTTSTMSPKIVPESLTTTSTASIEMIPPPVETNRIFDAWECLHCNHEQKMKPPSNKMLLSDAQAILKYVLIFCVDINGEQNIVCLFFCFFFQGKNLWIN